MADKEVVGQLGGFALGEVLQSLNLDSSTIAAANSRLGVSNAAFTRDSIYNGKFVDDVDEETDLEAQVDREMDKEKYLKKGMKVVAAAPVLMRGEEDEYDEYDEEEEGKGGAQVQVKDEPMEDDSEGLFGPRTTMAEDASGDEREEGEERYRETSAVIIAPPPPLKTVDVKHLFPTFEYGKVLDFTDLFSQRPRRRQKKTFSTVKCK